MSTLKIKYKTATAELPPVLRLSASTSSGELSTLRSDIWESVFASQQQTITVRLPSVPPVHLSENSHFKWERYLSEMQVRGRLSRIVTKAARALWSFFLEREPAIDVPHAGPTEDGGLLMVWDKGRHHFELEVAPSGRYDWFYRDRDTDKYRGQEDCTVGDYSEGLLSAAKLLWPDSDRQSSPAEAFEAVAAGA